MEYHTDLENEFINDLQENGRFILSVGCKGAGKSYVMMSFLKFALYHEMFEFYHFVCPVYDGEQSGSYDFLKTQKHVQIYKSYSEKVSKEVDKSRKKGKTLFLIDDGTGQLINNFDQTFLTIISTTRHFHGCCVWACVHAMKAVLKPCIRYNVDFLLMYQCSSQGLIEDLFEIFLSRKLKKFAVFDQLFDQVMAEKNSCILYDGKSQQIDCNVKYWGFVVEQFNNLKPHAPIKKPEPKKSELEKSKDLKSIFRSRLQKHKSLKRDTRPF